MGWLLVAVVLVQAQTEGHARARETAYARIPTAQKIASDPDLQKAIVSHNEAVESPDEIHRRDEEWKKNPRYPLRKELTQNACAARLRELVAGDAFIVEAFLMDERGGLVCSTVETSDYWQGDEAKWIKTYGENGRMFLDEPTLDASSDTYAVQLSMLVSRGEKKVGALTLTLKVPRQLVGK